MSDVTVESSVICVPPEAAVHHPWNVNPVLDALGRGEYLPPTTYSAVAVEHAPPLGANVTVCNTPAVCVTVFVTVFGYDVPLPAVTITCPVLEEVEVFAETLNAHVPLPEPEDVVNVIQETSLVALQDVLAVTDTDLLSPGAVAEVAVEPSDRVTARLPQSELLNADPAEFLASTQ